MSRDDYRRFLVGIIRSKPKDAALDNPLCELVFTREGEGRVSPVGLQLGHSFQSSAGGTTRASSPRQTTSSRSYGHDSENSANLQADQSTVLPSYPKMTWSLKGATIDENLVDTVKTLEGLHFHCPMGQ